MHSHAATETQTLDTQDTRHTQTHRPAHTGRGPQSDPAEDPVPRIALAAEPPPASVSAWEDEGGEEGAAAALRDASTMHGDGGGSAAAAVEKVDRVERLTLRSPLLPPCPQPRIPSRFSVPYAVTTAPPQQLRQ